MRRRLRIAVVSPFLDKRHGTERGVAEQVQRLAQDYAWEVHLFSQRVEELPCVQEWGRNRSQARNDEARVIAAEPPSDEGCLVWHKVPDVPGPHLIKFLWWLVANHVWRWRARVISHLQFDLIYSPGINCLDADAITVHIVFHEFYRRVGKELRLSRLPLSAWPRALHRRLYYGVILALEKHIYPRSRAHLATVSGLTAREMQRYFQRDDVTVIPNGIDLAEFNPQRRKARRTEARQNFGFEANDFVLLLIGNDWKTKGLDCLLQAVNLCRIAEVKVLVVGRDDRTSYLRAVERFGLGGRVRFERPSPDVMRFYAAADVYAGPSLYDSFAIPPAEAMACGLPVITSRQAGVADLIVHGQDGFVVENPADARELAGLLERLHADPELRESIGRRAVRKSGEYTWERNAEQTRHFLQDALERKCGAAAQKAALAR